MAEFGTLPSGMLVNVCEEEDDHLADHPVTSLVALFMCSY